MVHVESADLGRFSIYECSRCWPEEEYRTYAKEQHQHVNTPAEQIEGENDTFLNPSDIRNFRRHDSCNERFIRDFKALFMVSSTIHLAANRAFFSTNAFVFDSGESIATFFTAIGDHCAMIRQLILECRIIWHTPRTLDADNRMDEWELAFSDDRVDCLTRLRIVNLYIEYDVEVLDKRAKQLKFLYGGSLSSIVYNRMLDATLPGFLRLGRLQLKEATSLIALWAWNDNENEMLQVKTRRPLFMWSQGLVQKLLDPDGRKKLLAHDAHRGLAMLEGRCQHIDAALCREQAYHRKANSAYRRCKRLSKHEVLSIASCDLH